MKIGFMGRTKMLADTIDSVMLAKDLEVAFIWTSKDEAYYDYDWKRFEATAKEIGCPFIYSPCLDESKNIPNADVVISVNFVNLIPSWFLSRFKHGVLNAHPGDLPRYKGNACPNWAILNAEDNVVLIIHQMEESLDSGPIFCKSKFKLEKDTYIGEIYTWLSSEVPKLFLKAK